MGSGTIIGSFTAAAAPGANGYVVLRTPAGAAPTIDPVNGTSYTANATLGNATVVSSGAATTFTANNLNALTDYRFTVYSFNNTLCSGGPAYNITTPLNTPEQQTLASQTIQSVASGSWKNPATWSPAVVPSRNDFVQILGHTITIDTAAVDSTLSITGGSVLEFDATTAFSLTSYGLINVGGTFRTAATGTQTGHQVIARGNLNVGVGATLDFSTNNNTAGAALIFSDSLTGTTNTFAAQGNTVDLRTLTINKGLTPTNYTLEVTGNGFTVQGSSAPANAADSAAHGFLTLTNGQLKLSMTGSPTITRLFSAVSYTIRQQQVYG